MNTKRLSDLNKEELKKIKRDIDAELDNRDNAEWKAATKTIPELVKIYNDCGFIIPTNSKFWRIRSGEYRGCYGHQVGQYTHSCHVDTTDFIVVFVLIADHDFTIDSYDELSLDGPMIVRSVK